MPGTVAMTFDRYRELRPHQLQVRAGTRIIETDSLIGTSRRGGMTITIPSDMPVRYLPWFEDERGSWRDGRRGLFRFRVGLNQDAHSQLGYSSPIGSASSPASRWFGDVCHCHLDSKSEVERLVVRLAGQERHFLDRICCMPCSLMGQIISRGLI